MCSGTSIPNENQKRIEILKDQCNTYWTNFDRRRAYEWKLSLAIWTALAAFIALILDSKISLPSFSDRMVILTGALVVVTIVGIQAFFQVRVKWANDVDKRKAELYEELLNEMLNVAYRDTDTHTASEKEKEVGKAIAKVTPSKGNWPLFVHIGITAILIFLAVIVVLGKIHLERAELQKAAATNSKVAPVKTVANP